MFLVLMLPISNFICFRVKVFFLSCSSNVSSRLRDVHNAVYVPGATKPSSSILVPVGENVREQPSRSRNLQNKNDNSIGK